MPTQYIRAAMLPAWSSYAVMKLDHAANGRAGGDGVLKRDELQALAHSLEAEIDRIGARRYPSEREHARMAEAHEQLQSAHQLLGDLHQAGVAGLVYLPEDLLCAALPQQGDPNALVDLDDMDIGALAARIPEHLRRRAAELLMLDDEHRFGRLTPDVLHHARARYANMDPRVAMNMVRSKEIALREIDELGQVLGHQEAVRA